MPSPPFKSNNGPRAVPPDHAISPWQRAFCLLDDMNINEANTIRTLCSQLNDVFRKDEISCLSHLHTLHVGRLVGNCVQADFTAVTANIDLLMRLREDLVVPNDVRQKNRVLVTVCVKNETRLLLQSLVWHLLLGVDHYYICNNSPVDGLLYRVFAPFQLKGLVTIVDYEGGGVQHRCYNDGLAFSRANRFAWQGGLDADEFLVLRKNFTSIHQVLDIFQSSTVGKFKVGAVAFNWIMQPGYAQLKVNFPHDSVVTPSEKLGFFLGAPVQFVKSFVRTSMTRSWNNVHMTTEFMDENSTTVNTRGVPIHNVYMMEDLSPAVSLGALLHFHYRSAQELAAKRERGRGTVDCETLKSLDDPKCAGVHGARKSDSIVSDILEDYYSHTSCKPNLDCEGVLNVKRAAWQKTTINEEVLSAEVSKELLPRYMHLAHHTKLILTT